MEISEQPVGVAIIAKRIAAVLDENVKSVPAVHISNWLLKNGYLSELIHMNKRIKVSTQKGEALGIVTVDAVSPNGAPFRKNIYSVDAQRFIVNNIAKIEKEIAQ